MAAGESISLVAGVTDELTSITFPDRTTLLVHVAYDGPSQLSQPAGAEILLSMRVEEG